MYYNTNQRIESFLAIHGARQHVGFIDDQHLALCGIDRLIHLDHKFVCILR